MNVSEWAGRTDFSDFSLGKMDRLGNLFGAAARHHQTNQRNHQCELLAPLRQKKDEKNLSDHRFNSPQFNFLVGAFFNPLHWEKNICKSRARQIRSMSSRIRVFQLKKWFPTTKSYIPICAQQPSHVLFKMFDGFLCSLTITCHKASLGHKDMSHPRLVERH